MKHSLVLLIAAFVLPATVNAEIKDKTIISNTFNACVEQDEYPNGIGYQYSYCGCFVNKVSKGMTYKEFIGLELEAQLEDDPITQEKAVLANQKIKKYIVDCLSSTFEE